MIHARDITCTFKTKAGAVRMPTTLLPMSSGSANVGGHDVAREPALVRRKIGYVGQKTVA